MRNSMRRSGDRPALRSIMPLCTLDRAAHRVDHATELDNGPIAGALYDAPVMRGDGGVDQIAP